MVGRSAAGTSDSTLATLIARARQAPRPVRDTDHNIPEALTEGKAKFEAWVASVDAVVLAVAD